MQFRSYAAVAQEVRLKVSHFLPAVVPAQQRVLQPFCDSLKKDANGRIACQFYPAMQLGGTPAQLVDQAAGFCAHRSVVAGAHAAQLT